MRREKIKERLNTNEVFELYSKWVFTGPVSGRRVSIRFNWDKPPTSPVSCFQRHTNRRNIQTLG